MAWAAGELLSTSPRPGWYSPTPARPLLPGCPYDAVRGNRIGPAAPWPGIRPRSATPTTSNRAMRLMRKFSRILLGLTALLLPRAPAAALELPPWLPRYNLDIRLDVAG